jgi:polyferredoxin
MSNTDSGGNQVSSVPSTAPSKAPSTAKARKASRWVRIAVLGAVLALFTGIGIAHQRGVPVVGVDALCPFGGIESFWTLLTGGSLVKRIAVSSVILLAGVVLTAVIFRRAFCGYICPLGAVQEFFGMIGRKIFGRKRPEVPAGVDRVARYLKYVVLAGFTVWTWQAATLVMRPYDPWVAYMHLSSAELFAEFGIGAAVLGVTVIGSVVYERFFCKYACPMGALLALMSPLSVFKVRRDESACISCGACDAACPVNIKVSQAHTVSDPECINCNECVNACSTKNAIAVSGPGTQPKTSLKPNAVLMGAAAILALVIGATTVSGSFGWTVPSAAKALEPTTTESGAKTVNVDEIRGSMTFAEVAEATGVSREAIKEHFKVTDAEMDQPIKELAEPRGFDVHTDVREWFAAQIAAKQGK